VKQMAFTKSAAVRLFCVVMVYFEAFSTIFSRVKVLHELSEHTTLDHYQSTKFSYNCTASVILSNHVYNCWQYPWGQSSFHMHSDLLYHSLMQSFHPLSMPPVSMLPFLPTDIGYFLANRGSGRLAFEMIWNFIM
jgi:hypothetical protein